MNDRPKVTVLGNRTAGLGCVTQVVLTSEPVLLTVTLHKPSDIEYRRSAVVA